MSDTHAIHRALLRPAILHILRAQGFHSTRSSVLDTLTDLCAKHLVLLAKETSYSVYDRTSNDTGSAGPIAPAKAQDASDIAPTKADMQAPTLTDVRHALESTYFFPSGLTAGEEAWCEVLRKPLSTYPAGAARDKERWRRDEEDTRDLNEFIEWCTGPANREIRRIGGIQEEEDVGKVGGLGELFGGAVDMIGDGTGATAAKIGKDDYVTALKKKHSKTGDGARYARTVLGKPGDDRGAVKIDGGPESLEAWIRGLKKKVDITS